MTKSDELVQIAQKAGEILLARGWRLATVESCTGGWISQTVTSLEGSSDWFECGLVTYSNTSKASLAGVAGSLISRYGAVSAQVAEAMVSGALERTGASVAVSVTGIAGPGGGSEEKPVGTVWIATSLGDEVAATMCRYSGGRAAVRAKAGQAALAAVYRRLVDATA